MELMDVEDVDEEISTDEVEVIEDVEVEAEASDDDDDNQMSGWADSISKILNSKKNVKPHKLILSRAKKDADRKIKTGKKEESDDDIEIVSTNSKTKSSGQYTTPKTKSNRQKFSESNSRNALKKKKSATVLGKEWENLSRVKPNQAEDREFELSLMRIATKGVVQLFNAVSTHKKSLKEQQQQKKIKTEDDSDDGE